MNGYRCVNLRTYYPLEFVTAYLNRAEKEIDMLRGTSLAKKYGYKINPVQFRYSTSEYNFDRETKSIYKGIMSVKGLGKESGDELYSLRNNEYKCFSDLLMDIINNTSVNQGKVRKLVELDFFKEFGGAKKLIKIMDMFFGEKDQYKKKTAKKDDLPFDEALIRKYSTKETPKQYSGVDFVKIIGELEPTIPDESFELKQMVAWQIELLSYVDIICGNDNMRCVVVDKKENQWNTMVALYSLGSGMTQRFKLKRKDKRENFEIGDIMLIRNCEEKFRVVPRKDKDGEIIRKSDGKPKFYDEIDKKEWVLMSYLMEVM